MLNPEDNGTLSSGAFTLRHALYAAGPIVSARNLRPGGRTRICALALLLLFAACIPLDAQEKTADPESEESSSPFMLRGQIRELASFIPAERTSRSGDGRYLDASLTRIRLSPELVLRGGMLIFHADCDSECIASDYAGTPEFRALWGRMTWNDPASLSYRVNRGDVTGQLKLHRAYAKLSAGNVTLTAGRQQIRSGSGKLWNPLDIFCSAGPGSLEGAEETKGTDALRAEYYPGDVTELSCIINPQRKENRFSRSAPYGNTNMLLRAKSTFFDTEIACAGGYVCRRTIAGADISFLAADGLLRGSVLRSDPHSGRTFYMAGCGYEYSFSWGLSVIAEYFYNSASVSSDTDVRRALLQETAYGRNEQTYLMLSNRPVTYNRHYAGLFASYPLTPLIQGNLLFVWDAEGRALCAFPELAWNAAQNLDIAVNMCVSYQRNGAKKSDFSAYDRRPLWSAGLTFHF